MKYRKLPIVIEAVQFIGELIDDETPEWLKQALRENKIVSVIKSNSDEICLEIATLEGTMKANVGDYIIKGVNDEIYPCKPDIFEKSYEVEKGANKMEKREDILTQIILRDGVYIINSAYVEYLKEKQE